MAWFWWVLAAVALGVIEVLSVDLIFLMFGIGALAAALASALGAPLWVQVGVFAVVSLLLLFLVRPWAKSHLARSVPNVRTNSQGLVGEVAVVRDRVTSLEGRVLLAGEEWSARADQNWEIPVGTRVRVLAIDGATAVVGPVDTPVELPADRS
ncbi:NfeD family protein [Schaalia sp. 19OD2882]|uniref:NfeD family protein n=1 Tax=Schaalia sp. 19OD2882 TaxID=2794089 RepID=UPI001C1EC96C|nr:NfeD family protein [Schaalia sp. 19OD2882]QWW20458.1 NfeD family protein [Schaalia sp. 19OD2882]